MNIRLTRRRLLLASSAWAGLHGNVLALNQLRIVQANPSNLVDVLKSTTAGTDIILASGIYKNGLRLTGLIGTDLQPIRLLAANLSEPPLFLGMPGRNICSIRRCAHVHIVGLSFDALGLPDVDGIKLEGEEGNWSCGIHIEDCLFRGNGNNQQTVAINTKAPAWGWVIRRNRLESPGTGMYFGSALGVWPFVAGVIEDNVVSDPIGYAIQIKHQTQRPFREEYPLVDARYFSGNNRTIIRGNRLSKAKSNSALSQGYRPNLLLGHWPLQGAGANDAYYVYCNVFHDNAHETLLQAEGRVFIYNNVLINNVGSAIQIMPHNDRPLDFLVLHNTVLARDVGIGIRTSLLKPPERGIVAGNHVVARFPYRGAPRGSSRGHQSLALSQTYLPGDAIPTQRLIEFEAPTDTAELMQALEFGHLDFRSERRQHYHAGAFETLQSARVPDHANLAK